jgi:hypothetical protein
MTLFNGRIRRPVLALVLALGLLVGFITLVSISQSSTQIDQLYDESQGPVSAHGWANLESDPSLYATTPAIPASPYDKVVMSELGNATIRAELGVHPGVFYIQWPHVIQNDLLWMNKTRYDHLFIYLLDSIHVDNVPVIFKYFSERIHLK